MVENLGIEIVGKIGSRFCRNAKCEEETLKTDLKLVGIRWSSLYAIDVILALGGKESLKYFKPWIDIFRCTFRWITPADA